MNKKELKAAYEYLDSYGTEVLIDDVVYNRIVFDFDLDEIIKMSRNENEMCDVVLSLYTDDNDYEKDVYISAEEFLTGSLSGDEELTFSFTSDSGKDVSMSIVRSLFSSDEEVVAEDTSSISPKK